MTKIIPQRRLDVELGQNKQKQTGCYMSIVIPIIVIILIYNLLKLV